MIDSLGPEEFAILAEQNLAIHASWIQRKVSGMRVIEDYDVLISDSGLPCDTFNLVCHARLNDGSATKAVSAAITYFRQCSRPFSWWIGPADQPEDLGNLLVAAGLRPAATELAMAADLRSINQPAKPLEGLRIERVRTLARLRDFALIDAANWNPPDAQVLLFYELAAAVLLTSDCPLRLYVGYFNSIPVATSELALSTGVVGLYNIATLEQYRRRGFGAALTLKPLLDAREEGFCAAVLQAAPDGISVYKRVGFEAFGQITEYKPNC